MAAHDEDHLAHQGEPGYGRWFAICLAAAALHLALSFAGVFGGGH
jgi:hypothetical protein